MLKTKCWFKHLGKFKTTLDSIQVILQAQRAEKIFTAMFYPNKSFTVKHYIIRIFFALLLLSQYSKHQVSLHFLKIGEKDQFQSKFCFVTML